MISISVTLTVLFFVILGALFGLAKGYRKSVLRLITVAGSAIIAYCFSIPITKMLVTKKNINLLVAWLGLENDYNELVAISPAAEELIRALAISVIVTIVFVLLFFIMKGLTLILYFTLSKNSNILKNDNDELKEERKKTRLWGLYIGAAQGLLSMMVILVVLTGFFNLADNVIDTVIKNDNDLIAPSAKTELENIDSIFDEIKRDPIMSLFCYKDEYVYGDSMSANSSANNTSLKTTSITYGKNNFVFEGLTKIRFRGEKLSLTKESVVLTETVFKVIPLLEIFEEESYLDTTESIDDLVDVFSQSGILTEVGAELISGACEKWSNGEEFIGIAFYGIDDDIDPIILALFGTMKDSTSETLKEDLYSLVEVLSLFDKYKLLDSVDADSLIKNLSGDFIGELLTILSANERFNVVIPEVTNLSIRMIAKTLNIADVSELLLEPGHYELSEEDIKNLSEGFDHIFKFIDSIETLDNDDGFSFDTLDAVDISSMGQALDAFKKTELLGDTIDPIAGAVVSGVTGSSASDITDALENGDVSYESLMETVQSTAIVINNMQKEDATVEEKQQAIVELFENITPENADVIVAAVDENFVIQMGANPEYAEPLAEALSVSLIEMAGLDETEHEAEAEKVKYLFDIVSNSDKKAYGEDGIFESVEDIITVAMDSKVAGAVIMELAYDENGREVYDALGIAGSISNEDRSYISTQIQNYCNEKKETVSAEEAERIVQMAVAIDVLILGMK